MKFKQLNFKLMDRPVSIKFFENDVYSECYIEGIEYLRYQEGIICIVFGLKETEGEVYLNWFFMSRLVSFMKYNKYSDIKEDTIINVFSDSIILGRKTDYKE